MKNGESGKGLGEGANELESESRTPTHISAIRSRRGASGVDCDS
jgi:hypothetical protein